MQEPFTTARRPAAIKTQLADDTTIYIQTQPFGGEQQISALLLCFEEVSRAIRGIATPQSCYYAAP